MYQTVENVKGARSRNKLSALKLQEAEREVAERPQREAQAKERKNMLTSLRTDAAGGDADAQQQLLALDPEGGAEFIDALSKMDKRQREATKRTVDEMGQLSAYVLQGETPEKQQQRYNAVYQNVSPEIQERLPEQYDPQFVELSLSKATTMDKLLENPKRIQVGGEDVVYKGGREIERKKRPEDDKDGKGVDLKSSDESLMYRQAAERMGGMVDDDGNIRAIDPTVRPKVQAIASRASEIYTQGGGEITRSRAVSMAHDELEGSQSEDESSGVTYKEGQRARNADGDVLVYTNGKWVPAESIYK